ncbi:winged helix-turn-helix domain-containing protein [Micromonospora sp. CPCC 206060]
MTVSIDIALGTEPPGPALVRLLDLLGELVSDGAGEITVTGSDRWSPVPRSGVGLSLAVPTGPDPVAVPSAGGDRVLIQAASRVVRRGRHVLPLTRREFDLLLFLAENPRRVFTRSRLLTSVWGHRHALERTVDVHVRRLRVKIGADLALVTTVHGVGYRLADDAPVTVDPTR